MSNSTCSNCALCVELGDKDGLQLTYGNRALIQQAWGRLEGFGA